MFSEITNVRVESYDQWQKVIDTLIDRGLRWSIPGDKYAKPIFDMGSRILIVRGTSFKYDINDAEKHREITFAEFMKEAGVIL